MNKNSIMIINLKNKENETIVEKLRVKLGEAVDHISVFAFQIGVEPLFFRYHDKQKKLFISYPRFNMITTPTSINLYLKREGESFPTVAYKIKKSDVKQKLTSSEIDDYINEVYESKDFLESDLTNETLVIFDNLKVGVLLKTLEKSKEKTNDSDGVNYAKMFDLIHGKFNDVVDSGYLDLLNKVCVMMWQTWNSPKDLDFKLKEISTPSKVKKPETTKETKEAKATKINNKKEDVEKEEVEKPFEKPIEVPKLENINDVEELKEVEIDKDKVNPIIENI